MAQRGDYDYLLLREKKLQVFCQLQRAQRSTYLDRLKKKLEQLMIEYAEYFPTFTLKFQLDIRFQLGMQF